MLPKIENPPKNRTLEHTSINDPPFSTTSRSRIRYFSNRGRLISPVEKMGALWVPWLLAQHPYSKGPGISKPTGQAQASGLSTLAYRPGPSILTQAGIRTTTRIMAPITAKPSGIYCPNTSSSIRLPSPRIWPGNNFPADPL